MAQWTSCAPSRSGTKPSFRRATRFSPSIEGVLEGDGSRDRSVVEEDTERPAFRSAPEIRPTRIDPIVDFLPRLGADPADPPGLVGRQDRELHARIREHPERLVVDGGLRQPHTLGVASESLLEILSSPQHLRHLVAPRGQRQDHVIVDLGDGVAVTAVGLCAATVGLEDALVDVRRVAVEPREEGGSDVEGDLLEVVDDVDDAVVLSDPARGGVRRVALRRHTLVPVMIGRG